MNKTIRILLLFGLLSLPVCLSAQVKDPPQKQEIDINNLDVIYDSEEYEGVVIEPEEEEEEDNLMYQVPFFRESEEEIDAEEEQRETFTLTDEGVDSEDDILLEGFDTAIIHLPKFDVSTIHEPIVIELPRFSWPTPTTARPTSHYGPRRRRWHYGLDLAQPTGEPIYAAFDGIVRVSRRNKSYGNLVIIHHDNGLETYYAHMSKRLVKAGQHVRSGQQIGLCGNTGRSYGSHLHFEVRYRGNALNPESVVNCQTHDLVSPTLTLTSQSFRKTGGSAASRGTGTATGEWYRVRQGDTLEKIARRNGTTVRRLCQLNGIKETKILHPGDRLRVSGSTRSNTSASSTASRSTASSASSTAVHTVRSGDTLSKIARQYGTTVSRLCQLNGIHQNSVLRVGQKIKVK